MSEADLLVGRVVEELRSPTNGLRIVFDVGDRVEPALYADIEQSFTFVDASGTHHRVDGNEPSSFGPVLAIAGQTVERVSTDDAVLSLHFSDGSSLRCEPHLNTRLGRSSAGLRSASSSASLPARASPYST